MFLHTGEKHIYQVQVVEEALVSQYSSISPSLKEMRAEVW